jgi:hypothetical protein
MPASVQTATHASSTGSNGPTTSPEGDKPKRKAFKKAVQGISNCLTQEKEELSAITSPTTRLSRGSKRQITAVSRPDQQQASVQFHKAGNQGSATKPASQKIMRLSTGEIFTTAGSTLSANQQAPTTQNNANDPLAKSAAEILLSLKTSGKSKPDNNTLPL